MADGNTLAWEIALVAKPQRLELSTALKSFCLPQADMREGAGPVCLAINIGAHKPPRSHTSVQALGTTPALTLHAEMMPG
jgi:hypothetical protein